jgi:two-component system sensor kinase FixL
MHSSELQAVMDAAVDAVILVDHTGAITGFNRSAERLFGYSSQEVLGRNVSILMPEPYRSSHNDYISRYAESGIPHIIGIGREVEARRKDGTVFPAFLSVGQVAGATPPRFVGLIRDVTTERQALATLQAERDRAEAREAAEQDARRQQERLTHVSRMATLGEMAAGIAHEINQPLSAIATYARACERFLTSPEPDLEETLSSVREIAQEALRAGEIIRRLRQILASRPAEHVRIELNRLIEDLSVLTGADARVNQTLLRLELEPALPAVHGDPAQLQQLVLNLVRNAIEAVQATPPGAREITIRTTRNGSTHVEISVSDNGPGVEPAMVEKLFTPFATTKAQGTGLGLSMSQTIARVHGGTIGYRPRQEGGACFFVRLPTLEEPAPGEKASQA